MSGGVHTAPGPTDSGATGAGAAIIIDGGGGGGVAVGGDSGVLDIDVSPVPLTPSFSSAIHDYYVRCGSGQNALTVTVTDGGGSQSISIDIVEDQEIDVRQQYWIRCLPHDFPVITVTAHPGAGAPTAGYYLVNNGIYAVALDTNGTPVWYARGTDMGDVEAFAPDTISFTPDLMGPFGSSSANHFEIHALDTLKVTTVSAAGSPTDGHELRLLANGDHLLLTYPIENDVDLTGLQSFGPDETIADCEVQEIDPSGHLVWSWLATDHVDPTQESIEPAAETVNGASLIDVFHFNSIDVDGSGNLLLSARHTNAIFYVDRSTGDIRWKLGGSAYNKDGAAHIWVTGDPQTAFNMQHDARFLPNGDISLFDDHGAATGDARGVEYAIDFEASTAAVAFQFLGIGQSQYEGSFRRYPDGESVIGWGYVPSDPRVVTEVNSSGQDVLDIAFSGGQPSYRAVKVPLSQLDIAVLRATTAK